MSTQGVCESPKGGKKSPISEVVKEGLTEKVGFEQYLVEKHWISSNKITRIGESMAGQDRREQTQIMSKRQELALFGEPARFRKGIGK